MGDPAEHHVGHAVNLRFHRRIQPRVVVAMNGCPPGGHTVHQLFAAGQRQLAAVCFRHRVYRQGLSHGGVGMPDMALIEGEIVRCHNRLVNHFENI